ncbi:hypothetical protein D9758_001996 [Tetrapyrgos nigripes]|uniref:Zn(2)-C6 fungal-type domain-containing protein n=1 Tax=Tetrapyrgos nigripes TaxID=182062 RepID=A0A8H5GSY6_9AGAR|nr:hypothetical protein D9758_001996 [Tetrapyrgos nigripes]
MSTELLAKKKKSTTTEAKAAPDGDHRKRRRNRTTQSCLNCHTSKRMCDRKRPACARCTQLGLTGLCVYEVDDPNQRADAPDENSRLLKRVAELEGVIRELKNKPNPRWMHHGNDLQSGSEPISTPANTCSETLPSAQAPFHSPPAGSPISSSPVSNSPPATPSPLTPVYCDFPSSNALFSTAPHSPELDLNSFFSLYPELWGSADAVNQVFRHEQGNQLCDGDCSCLLEAPSYSVLLELSLRLRKAAETLSQSPSHLPGSRCSLNQRIRELDSLATHALCSIDSISHQKGGSMDIYPSGSSPMLSQTLQSSQTWGLSSSTVSPSPAVARYDDMFMTWEPTRRT